LDKCLCVNRSFNITNSPIYITNVLDENMNCNDKTSNIINNFELLLETPCTTCTHEGRIRSDNHQKNNLLISYHTHVCKTTKQHTEIQSSVDNSLLFDGIGLFIASLNIQHLLPKLDEIKHILHNCKSPKIIGLCETFLNDNINNDYVYIRNYNCERRDRSNGKGRE
jgi:hypothetical protein